MINGFALVILYLGGMIMLLPFLWMVSASVKGLNEIYAFPPRFIPEEILWSNYLQAWRVLPFGRFFLNSGLVAICVVVGQLFTCSLAGYSFARLRYPGRDRLFLLYLSTMMIPFAVIIIPLYVQMRWFGWIDTLWPLIVPAIFAPWGTFLMRQFMSTLPPRTRGCRSHRWVQLLSAVFRKIILPLTKPALATLGIFTFLGTWNSFLWPLIIISSISNKTLPLGLVMFRTRLPMETPWQLVMAASTFSIIPVLIIFVMGQKYYVRGIVTSGIKGGA